MTTPASLPKGLSWEDFLTLPDVPDYRHAELIDGEVVVNALSRLHQQVVMRLASALDAWTRAQPGRGEVTLDPPVQVAAARGYLPDVAWFPAERCAPPGQPPAFTGPPALVVEVLSPTTRAIDAVRKRTDYARVGVEVLWLVDPDEPAALILRRPAGASADAEFVLAGELDAEGTLASPPLPDLAITLGDLLAR